MKVRRSVGELASMFQIDDQIVQAQQVKELVRWTLKFQLVQGFFELLLRIFKLPQLAMSMPQIIQAGSN